MTKRVVPVPGAFVTHGSMNSPETDLPAKVLRSDAPSGSAFSSSGTDMHSEAFLHSLMRRQLRLSISCAMAFLIVLLGLPLANYFAPELMAKRGQYAELYGIQAAAYR